MSFAVYKHFDADGQPLYVGCSVNVEARQYAHKRAPWWPLSAKMEVFECHKESLAHEYERREIYRLRPRFNHQHNPDKGNWTPPKKPRADRPNETDRVLWIMENKPIWEWPAAYRADYCRLLNKADPKAPKIGSPQVYYNWKRKGLPGFEPETYE